MTTFLAFDTATELLSIALSAPGRVLTHESSGGAQASGTLIPAILALLERAGITLAEIDAIAFGRGPGAFTGLRTACAVSQGLAYGARKPVLPIDTLLALAEDARGGRPAACVWAVLDARMDEIYAAQYTHGAEGWTTIDVPMLITPEALNARWAAHPPELVAGNALTVFGARLETGAAELLPEALPRAAAMLPLAQAMWDRGERVDAAHALPLYLRDKVAQTTEERDAARAAKEAL